MDARVPSLDITSLRSISHIQSKIHFTNMDISFSPEYFPNGLIHINIYASQYKATNP